VVPSPLGTIWVVKSNPARDTGRDGTTRPRLPDFSRSKHTKTGQLYQIGTNYTKRPYIIPNGHKLYQTAVKYTNIFQGPPKYTPIRIFGLKINHLATLPLTSPLLCM
jgi:hypothetical protein